MRKEEGIMHSESEKSEVVVRNRFDCIGRMRQYECRSATEFSDVGNFQ
jgi:hypothetical protein